MQFLNVVWCNPIFVFSLNIGLGQRKTSGGEFCAKAFSEDTAEPESLYRIITLTHYVILVADPLTITSHPQLFKSKTSCAYSRISGEMYFFRMLRKSKEKLGKPKWHKLMDKIWTHQIMHNNSSSQCEGSDISDSAPYWLKLSGQCCSTLKQVFHFLSTRAQSYLNTHTHTHTRASHMLNLNSVDKRKHPDSIPTLCYPTLGNKVQKPASKLTG